MLVVHEPIVPLQTIEQCVLVKQVLPEIRIWDAFLYNTALVTTNVLLVLNATMVFAHRFAPLPETVSLISSAFKVILQNISKRICTTINSLIFQEYVSRLANPTRPAQNTSSARIIYVRKK